MDPVWVSQNGPKLVKIFGNLCDIRGLLRDHFTGAQR